MFCKHKWIVIQDTLTKSPIERLDVKTFEGAGSDMLLSTHETIISCEKCGKLKRFVERA